MSGDDAFYQEFGKRLRAARKKRGMSQADLATAVGLTRTSISNVEKGRQKVVLHTFAALLDVLKQHPHELLPAPGDERPVLDRGVSQLAPDLKAFVERAFGRTTKENDGNSADKNTKRDQGAS